MSNTITLIRISDRKLNSKNGRFFNRRAEKELQAYFFIYIKANTVEMLNKRENYAKLLRKVSKQTLLNNKRRKFIDIEEEDLKLKEEANKMMLTYYPNLALISNSSVSVLNRVIEGKTARSCFNVI